MLQNFVRWLRRMQMGPDSRRIIIIDADGFALMEGDRVVGTLRWSDVDEISAYKTDDFTYDTIWLEFNVPSRDEVFAINDENEGFWDVVRTVKRVLPSSVQNWEERVIQPPFARNWTKIYQHEDAGHADAGHVTKPQNDRAGSGSAEC